MVHALSMLGAADEPARMEGAGPAGLEVAIRFASTGPSLYRWLVDPFSCAPLDAAPKDCRVSKAMRTALRIRDEYCQFLGCMSTSSNAQIDHIRGFDSGASAARSDLEVLCLHRHLLILFKKNQKPKR